MDFAKNNPQLGLTVLFLDFRKAYDSVSHDMMIQLLGKMGYPEDLIQWVNLIYTRSYSMLRYKGWFSEEFSLFHSVCQGCPLSCHLFNLVSQVTIYYLHQKGIFAQLLFKAQHNFDPSSMFVDDVAFLCRRADLERNLSALEICGTYTSLQLNLAKTVSSL